MVTKGIVESVNEYKATVRLPIFDGIEGVKNSTLTVDLSEAPICTLPNASNIVSEGDIVYVAFEDNDIGQPVIIGHLYKESGTETKINLDLGSLTTSLTSKLSDQTYIGNVSPNEIKSLSGIKANIQNQISLLSDKLTTTQDSVNSELNSLSSNISQVDSDYNNMSLSLAVEEVSTGNKLTVTLNNVDGQVIASENILIPMAEVLSNVDYTQDGYIAWTDNSNFNSNYTYYILNDESDYEEISPEIDSETIYYVYGNTSSLILWFTTYNSETDSNDITFTAIPITDLIASLESELSKVKSDLSNLDTSLTSSLTSLETKLANYNTGGYLEDDDNFVHKDGSEEITGTKTFSSSDGINVITSTGSGGIKYYSTVGTTQSRIRGATDGNIVVQASGLYVAPAANGTHRLIAKPNSNSDSIGGTIYSENASYPWDIGTSTRPFGNIYAKNLRATNLTYTTSVAEQVYSGDDYIYLRYNDDESSVLALDDNQYSGIEILNYDGENNFRLVVDNTGTARAGDDGDEKPLALRDEASNMLDDVVVYWDASNLILKNDIGHNYISLSDGVNTRTFLYLYDDGDSNNWGSELVLTGNGNTFIGAGESPTGLRTEFQTNGVVDGEKYSAAGKQLYITSDNNIYLYSGTTNDATTRTGIVYDNSGNLRPLVTGTRQLGSSSYHWDAAYINTVYGNLSGSAEKVENALTLSLNNSSSSYDGSAAISESWYAPTTGGALGTILIGAGTTSAPTWLSAGTSGYILQAKGSANPTWVSQSTLSVGIASSVSYTTTAPTASPASGSLIFYVGSSLPSTRYDGVVYLITV